MTDATDPYGPYPRDRAEPRPWQRGDSPLELIPAELGPNTAAGTVARSLGRSVRAWREARGLSQRDLAAQLEWEQSSVARLEGGIIAPTFPALHHLATRLGLVVDLHVTDAGIAVDIREAEAAA